MDDEEFAIEFNFKGREYSGIATTNKRNGTTTFIIRYSMEPARQFEKTIEIYIVSDEATNTWEWKELPDEIGQRVSDKDLVTVIGESVEDREDANPIEN